MSAYWRCNPEWIFNRQQEARKRGANAVVAVRFDCSEIGDIMFEVAACGTAVTAEPYSQSAS
jgi:uncharacterized protein YbjQ (UPF0145 family)